MSMSDCIMRADAISVIRNSICDLEYVSENDELVEEIKQIPAVCDEPLLCCKECQYFMRYTDNFKRSNRSVQGADGDCFLRVKYSDNHQFIAVQACDYCSLGERKLK